MEHTEKSNVHTEKGLLGKIKRYLSKRPLPSPTDRKKFDQDFAISTSFHGIHNIAQNQSKVRKVIWLSVVLGSVSLLVWQIYSRLFNYFTWPTTTSIEVQYVEKIEFPAVTVCNLNRFQTEAVSRFGLIFFLWDIVSKVLRLQEISTNHTDSPETLDFVTNHQNFSITDFVKKNGFYLNHDTLVHCEFFGKTCGPKDFKHIFTEYGNCFTFNHGENIQSKNKVSVSGRGLKLLLDVHQEEFTDNPVPGFADAGVIFVIHSPKKEPQFDGLGLSSPVGMHARVTIRQLKTVHQEYPWGECIPDIKLRNFTTYSTYGCLKECKAQHIQQLCGCLPFLLPGNGVECDLLKYYNCVSPILEYIERKGLCTMGTHNSSCPVSCEETEYPATVSYSTFPSQKATKFLAKKLNQSQEYIREPPGQTLETVILAFYHQHFDTIAQRAKLGLEEAVTRMKKQLTEQDAGVSRHSWMLEGFHHSVRKHTSDSVYGIIIRRKEKQPPRENLVNIEINYSDLNYKITQQQKAVSVPELLADVGGQLGLFCGASLITIIEIIEYVFTSFYWIFIFFLLKVLETIQRTSSPEVV